MQKLHTGEPGNITLQEAEAVFFEAYTSQSPGRIRTGIDVDAIWPDFRCLDRRMTMHNQLFEKLVVLEKFVPNPHQIRGALSSKTDPGTNARMCKKNVTE